MTLWYRKEFWEIIFVLWNLDGESEYSFLLSPSFSLLIRKKCIKFKFSHESTANETVTWIAVILSINQQTFAHFHSQKFQIYTHISVGIRFPKLLSCRTFHQIRRSPRRLISICKSHRKPICIELLIFSCSVLVVLKINYLGMMVVW